MSEPGNAITDGSLAATLWKMAQAAAREQYEPRIAALEEDVAAIREHLVGTRHRCGYRDTGAA